MSSPKIIHRADHHHVVILSGGDGADGVFLSTAAGADEPADVLVIAAMPHNEPVKQYASVAMNTDAQIQGCLHDIRFAKNGFEGCRGWQSVIARDCEILPAPSED